MNGWVAQTRNRIEFRMIVTLTTHLGFFKIVYDTSTERTRGVSEI